MKHEIDPHYAARIYSQGAPVSRASAAMIMVHGRGATAMGILSLAEEFAQPDFHYTAPQAIHHVWYPYSFLEPREKNQPGIDSGFKLLDSLVQNLQKEGIDARKIILLGFSQGACLVSDFAARYPRRFGGIVLLSGGLIGDKIQVEDYSGSLFDTPVFMGCSDRDPHVPALRIEETAQVFKKLNASVDKRIYKGMGHTINEDEVKAIRGMMAGVKEQ